MHLVHRAQRFDSRHQTGRTDSSKFRLFKDAIEGYRNWKYEKLSLERKRIETRINFLREATKTAKSPNDVEEVIRPDRFVARVISYSTLGFFTQVSFDAIQDFKPWKVALATVVLALFLIADNARYRLVREKECIIEKARVRIGEEIDKLLGKLPRIRREMKQLAEQN